MNVAVVTTVSEKIDCYARLTVPNKYAYCMRHGYSLVVENAPYKKAISGVAWMSLLLERFEMIWALDADAVITNMSVPIHTLSCLGPHVTVCEEGIVSWNLLNCGSVVYRATKQSAELLIAISERRAEWEHLSCGWQTWLADRRDQLGDTLTVAPLRAFNSCVWNRPAGVPGPPGSHWKPGDLVFHANGVYPLEERTRVLREALERNVKE